MSENLEQNVSAESGPEGSDGGEVGGDDVHPISKLNDAIIIGGPLPEEILSRRITLAQGRSAEDKRNWHNCKSTIGRLLNADIDPIRDGHLSLPGALFSKFERGDKDGTCYLQGRLVEDGKGKTDGKRAKKSVAALDVLMLDVDVGVPLGEIVDRVWQSGLFAIIYTTHSHLKPESTIPENELLTWAREKYGASSPTTEHAVAYLLTKKSYRRKVLDGATLDGRRQVAVVGMSYVVKHQPMPRARIVFVLDEAFVFAERPGTHDNALVEWEELYSGVATILGVPFDTTCTTPDRLMYPPRVDRAAPIGENAAEIVILNGKMLDLSTIERVAKPGKRKKDDPIAVFDRVREDDRRQWKTKNLARFAAIAGHDFDAKEFMLSISALAANDKILCPNHEEHSTGADTGFWVINASESTSGKFAMGCHHTCQEKSGDDRLWYLDRACEIAGIEDAAELLKFCSEETRAAWDGAPDARLEEYNRRFAVVQFGADARILAFPDDKGTPYEQMKLNTFHLVYQPEQVEVGEGDDASLVPLSRLWIKSTGRRTYHRVVFDPSGKDLPDHTLNLWRGFAVDGVAGDWSQMRGHLFSIICRRNPYWFAWLMCWLANIVQHPANKPGTSVAVRGLMGTGKSYPAERICELFPHNSMSISKRGQLLGRFNSHLANKLFICAEEAFWAGDHEAEGAVKDLITSPTQVIEAKGVDAIQVANHNRLWYCANAKWVVPTSSDTNGTKSTLSSHHFAVSFSIKRGHRSALIALTSLRSSGESTWINCSIAFSATFFVVPNWRTRVISLG